MRNLILSLTVALCSFCCSAQNYLPFPDSAAIWVNTGYNVGQFGVTLTYSEYFCANGEDTIIGATTYTQMKNCISGEYLGAFRDDAGQVFYLPSDSIGERLIYDFSAMPSDTIDFYAEDQVFGDDWYEFEVNDWDTTSMEINGVSRRVINMQDGSWIEGIGSTNGFLQVPIPNISNYAPWLYCMSHLDTIQYGYSASQSGVFVSCDFFIGINELEKSEIEVYPNPVVDRIQFDTDEQINAVLIANSEGRAIGTHFTKQGNTISVAMDFLPPGNYQMLIKTDRTFYTAHVVKD